MKPDSATWGIWFGMGIGLFALLIGQDTLDIYRVLVVLMMLMAAAFATGMVWYFGLKARELELAESGGGKAKRDDSLSRMLDSLDEEQIEVLRQRLSRDDADEKVSLDTLLVDDDGEMARR